MAVITSGNAQALMDSVAKHISDQSALIGSSANVVAGQATMLNRIAALNDPAQIYLLMDAFQSAVLAENGWLTAEALYNTILDLWFPSAAALDNATGGLPAFMAAVPIYCDPHFLDAFNRAQKRGNVLPAKALAAWQAFGQAIANMAQITVSGATTGVFLAGTSQAAAYGNAPLSIFNAAGVNTGATPTVVTVTYNNFSAAGAAQTGLTATATMPAASVPNAAVTLAVNGTAITAISITGGNTADVIGVKATLLRVATY